MGYRIVRMTEEIFQQMLTEGFICPTPEGKQIRCAKGLPPGARIVDFSRDLFFDQGQWALKVYHPDWEDTPSGNALPELKMEFVYEDAPAATFAGDLTPMEELELRRKREDPAHRTG